MTPATDLMSDMKSSGNHTMQMSSTMIMPPMPYLTTFFFFWPRGCGYLCNTRVRGRAGRPERSRRERGRGASPGSCLLALGGNGTLADLAKPRRLAAHAHCCSHPDQLVLCFLFGRFIGALQFTQRWGLVFHVGSRHWAKHWGAALLCAWALLSMGTGRGQAGPAHSRALTSSKGRPRWVCDAL